MGTTGPWNKKIHNIFVNKNSATCLQSTSIHTNPSLKHIRWKSLSFTTKYSWRTGQHFIQCINVWKNNIFSHSCLDYKKFLLKSFPNISKTSWTGSYPDTGQLKKNIKVEVVPFAITIQYILE